MIGSHLTTGENGDHWSGEREGERGNSDDTITVGDVTLLTPWMAEQC